MLSVIIPSKISETDIVSTVVAIHRHFSFRSPGAFEIIVVPNPVPLDWSLQEVLNSSLPLKNLSNFTERHREVRIVPHSGRVGKYAAIRAGVKASVGDLILITDADLPFDLSFFDEAAHKLRSDFDFVVGNRRHPKSEIKTPIKLLKMALVRDRIGRTFNLGVRLLFPSISIRDTQAGIKGMTRSFASHAFQLQTCPGFYGDLELFLVAMAHQYKVADIPVVFNYGENKSSIRFFREFFVAMGWLIRIYIRNFLGAYDVSLGLDLVRSSSTTDQESKPENPNG